MIMIISNLYNNSYLMLFLFFIIILSNSRCKTTSYDYNSKSQNINKKITKNQKINNKRKNQLVPHNAKNKKQKTKKLKYTETLKSKNIDIGSQKKNNFIINNSENQELKEPVYIKKTNIAEVNHENNTKKQKLEDPIYIKKTDIVGTNYENHSKNNKSEKQESKDLIYKKTDIAGTNHKNNLKNNKSEKQESKDLIYVKGTNIVGANQVNEPKSDNCKKISPYLKDKKKFKRKNTKKRYLNNNNKENQKDKKSKKNKQAKGLSEKELKKTEIKDLKKMLILNTFPATGLTLLIIGVSLAFTPFFIPEIVLSLMGLSFLLFHSIASGYLILKKIMKIKKTKIINKKYFQKNCNAIKQWILSQAD